MKVLVITGTRRAVLGGVIDEIDNLVVATDLLLVGDATGVDQFARYSAKGYKIPYDVFHAGWRGGKGAGPARNGRIVMAAICHRAQLDYVECHAFPDADSVGTWDCVRQLEQAGFKVVVHE